ncbi:hypothetical protein BKE30_14550 [Alkanindiges hydrocarboniclasticus]|uniref:Uncharacterized protein n=1 Tax=Alkanindiges hydrocarboniclasticus TaxID=1907941 RepID=A0A1S8CS95_9GAMM|nr:hypothetical protein [Alkanindiges hydrocarboniclasticus]ONG37350.1 hypothetical protein BKE30_14550 [Alkanindiges hydrocarboniclasticus]
MVAIAKDYSDIYRTATRAAIIQSQNLKFPNQARVTPESRIPDHYLEALHVFSRSQLINYLAPQFNYPYWGTSCLQLATAIFAYLNAIDLPADIVFGEVTIHGTDEYDVTLENLIHEYTHGIQEGEQAIHAWVTVGDDIIIDAAMPDRLHKYYHFPLPSLPEILVGRAYELAHYFKCQYKPMLVGADFITRTNLNRIDPLQLVEQLKPVLNP